MKENINEQQNFVLENKESNVEFRELAPEEFWSSSIQVNDIRDKDFAEKVKQTVIESDTDFYGYRTDFDKENDSFTFHFSRYPRRNFGPVASKEILQNALTVLENKIGVKGKEEEKSPEPKFRILLGLEEGYAGMFIRGVLEMIKDSTISTLEQAKQKLREYLENDEKLDVVLNNSNDLEELQNELGKINFTKIHTINEVRKNLGENFDLKEAEIYTVTKYGIQQDWPPYTEPAIVIEGDINQINKAYDLATKFHQSRIAVDDLHKGQSYMVETKHCDDPDKE